MRTALLILVVSTLGPCLASCARNPNLRKPASGPRPPTLNTDGSGLLEAADAIAAQLKSDDFNPATCVAYLGELQDGIQRLRPWQFAATATSAAPASLEELSWRLWQVRLALHDQLPRLDSGCIRGVRDTSRLLRFAEDYLLEHDRHVAPVDPGTIDYAQVQVPLQSAPPEYVFYTRAGRDVSPEFHDGDVMLSRGISFLSAMIARLGDIESQFSHVIFVHQDDARHLTETIESYVGVGVKTYDLPTALRNENVRLLLLRSRDPGLAARASDSMYHQVQERVAQGKPIPYDYRLDFGDHSAMSCAEVAEAAFEEASQGGVVIPFYPSTLQSAPALIRRLGMSPGKTFEPGDLEVDPRFDLVGEWRDLRATRDSRQKDAILTSMIQWMDQDGYDLRDSTKTRIGEHVIWPARRTFLWPLVQKLLKVPDFSAQIPRNMFHTVLLVNQVGDVLYRELRARDDAFLAEHGWPMTYRELYDALEDIRAKDRALYDNRATRKQAKFHAYFRAG